MAFSNLHEGHSWDYEEHDNFPHSIDQVHIEVLDGDFKPLDMSARGPLFIELEMSW